MSCCITSTVSVSSDPYVPGMTKEEVIRSAQLSVVDGCGIPKEEFGRIDANFGTVLEARVAALYDQCTGGGAGL